MSRPEFLWFFLAFSSWSQNGCLVFHIVFFIKAGKRGTSKGASLISVVWKAELSQKFSPLSCKPPHMLLSHVRVIYSHLLAARKAWKVRAEVSWLTYLLPCPPKWGFWRHGKWKKWILGRLYYLLCIILIHEIIYISLIGLSTI